jgi:hypothetical protein
MKAASSLSMPSPTWNVSAPFFTLIALLVAAPATLFFDGLSADGATAVAVALAAALVAVQLRPGEGLHLATLCRPWAIVAAAPIGFMVLQALPVPWLAHPIWASASEALDAPLTGAISIDPTITLIALGRYLSLVAVVFVAASVSIERQRAQALLFVLMAVLAAATLALAWVTAGGDETAAVPAMGALGIIVAVAAMLHAVERIETRRSRSRHETIATVGTIAICLVAALADGAVLLLWSSIPVIVACGCGIGVLASTAIARRIGAGPRITLACVAGGLIVVLAVTATGISVEADPTLRFAVEGPTETAARMLADVPWLGTGAGTFAALQPIYAGINDVAGAPPTAAAAIAIELGRPMLVLALAIAIAIASSLLWGAMSRGRDWIYAAATAGAVVLVTIEAFLDSALLDSAMGTLVATVMGLGLAQRVGRSAT